MFQMAATLKYTEYWMMFEEVLFTVLKQEKIHYVMIFFHLAGID